jgi:cytochrome c peroxidase
MRRTILVITLIILISTVACQKQDMDAIVPDEIAAFLNLPSTPFNYSNVALPQYYLNLAPMAPGPNTAAITEDNTPTDNRTTDHGATLGRVLFYDKSLSANGTVACASCHVQKNGFSDNEKLSKGFEGGLTRRHSMGLANARFYRRAKFFWDERANTLEQQVLMPFQDAVEMGMTLPQVVSKVNSQPYYRQLFINAFGNQEVTSDKISKALAQFIRSMVSVNSKYDEGRARVNNQLQDFPNFSLSENNGKRLFFQPIGMGGFSCVVCHTTDAFISPDRVATVNGIDAVSEADKGIFEHTPTPLFLGAFKVPSLKNIAVTQPYMHDGRFTSLEQVVEHYNSGIKNHINLSPTLRDRNGNPIRLNMTQAQKTDLVAFLNTLTDTQMLTDEKFSNPFKK